MKLYVNKTPQKFLRLPSFPLKKIKKMNISRWFPEVVSEKALSCLASAGNGSAMNKDAFIRVNSVMKIFLIQDVFWRFLQIYDGILRVYVNAIYIH